MVQELELILMLSLPPMVTDTNVVFLSVLDIDFTIVSNLFSIAFSLLALEMRWVVGVFSANLVPTCIVCDSSYYSLLFHLSLESKMLVFLVGGFGSSPYLHKRVQQEFESRVPLIRYPPRPDLAVVRGAVYHGLTHKPIQARVARRWYGVDTTRPYKAGDPIEKKYMQDGKYRVRDGFSVFVRPGQSIGVDECISKKYITHKYPEPLSSPLYVYNGENQPDFVDSPGVQKLCDFTIPLPHMPGAAPGTPVIFTLRMYFGLTELRAEAEFQSGEVISTLCQF